MPYLILFLILFWTIRCVKAELFWLYLLQLKEYKLKRFVDHFRTEKGQRILLDKINLLKMVLVFISPFIYGLLGAAVLGIYLAESAVIIKNLLGPGVKKPVITSKSASLIIIFVALQILFGILALQYVPNFNELALYLLVFDILIPVISLLIIAPLKPINRLLRQKIINAAKQKRTKLENLLVIGITGSYGKTSTKEFLYEILKDKFNVIRTPEHVNTEIGASHFILDKVTPKHEIFICEMGAYERGEIRETADIVKPQIGMFLGANEQHLSLFGSMDNLLKAEGGEELLEALKNNQQQNNSKTQKALAIFNGNNPYAYELWKRADIPKRITYVPNLLEIVNPEKRDVRAENIRVAKDHIAFKVLTNKNSKGVEFKVDVIGGHNIENILLCVALGEMIGMTLGEIAEAARNIKPLPRTMSMLKNKDGVNIINSTYSSNPSALIAHLEYLKVWDPTSSRSAGLRRARKIVIMPCLIELGSESGRIHESLGKSLARVADLVIVTTKDKFADILSGASSSIGTDAAKEMMFYIEDPAKIIEKIKDFCRKGDVILLEGRLPDKLIEEISD